MGLALGNLSLGVGSGIIKKRFGWRGRAEARTRQKGDSHNKRGA